MEFIMKISNNVLDRLMNPTIETRPLKWREHTIPSYYVSSDGKVYYNNRLCSTWQKNGRNYAYVEVPNHSPECRIDYIVAYTFIGCYDDTIRLIHINNDISDDSLNNLMWYRKSDVIRSYINLGIIEDDGCIKEEWRPCYTEYNTSLGYEVSNLGQIRDSNHKLVELNIINSYYGFYYLDKENGNRTRVKLLHRAVAEAFIPNPNNYNIVNHLDGNKLNNLVSNLEWANISMNTEHAYLQNLNSSTRYSDRQIQHVCRLLENGNIPHIEIAKTTGVDHKTVSDIYSGRRWQHISKHYNFAPRKWTPEIKQKISDMIIKGMKGKEIFYDLNIPYDQAAISLYERTRRELKAQGKI